MSDMEDDSKPDSNEKRKTDLKSATNKLKAEALRRLQLEDAEYDEAKTNQDQDVHTTGELATNENILGQPDPTNVEKSGLSEKNDNLNQNEKILEASIDLKSSPDEGLNSKHNIHSDAVEAATSDEVRPNQTQNEAEPASMATEPTSDKQKAIKEQRDTGETAGSSTADERLEEENRKDISAGSIFDNGIKHDSTIGDSRGSIGTQPIIEEREVSDNKIPSSSAEQVTIKSSFQGGEEVEDPKNSVIGQNEGKNDSGDAIFSDGRDSSSTEAITSVEQAKEALSAPSTKATEATDTDKMIPPSSTQKVTTKDNSQESEEAIKEGETVNENEQKKKGEEIGNDKRVESGKDEKEEKHEFDRKEHDTKERKSAETKEIVDIQETKSGIKDGKVQTKTSNVVIPDIVSAQSTETETKSDTNRHVDVKEKSIRISPPLSKLPEDQTENKHTNNSYVASIAGDNKDIDTKSDNLISTDQNSVIKQDDSNSDNKIDSDRATNDIQTNDGIPQDVLTMNSKDNINETGKSSQEEGKIAQCDIDDKQETGEKSQPDEVETNKQDKVVNETFQKESDIPKETRKDDEIDGYKEGVKKSDSEGQQKDKESKEVEDNEEKLVKEDLFQEGALETQGVEDEEEAVLPDDFFYDFENYVSKPYSSEGIPNNLLTLHHSFGYECTKRENLHVMDEETILFSAGNMGQLLNIKTKEQIYFRTTGGGGIGAIAIHPSRKYFAVAEKGIKPNINVFEYPSLKLYRVLRDGTEEAYSNLDFSPDGTKLASVGCAPDYMLTVWDWKNEKIMLRYKAFSQDIYKVAFSPDNEGHVNTSGSGHIRFWTMANTFTGLKLQGMIGKFGAKEISDIEGFVELPDGKVLSGSDWGNMLLWEGGLIKVEISKKGKKPCHHGMIQQFFMDEGELMTIGVDGFVKVWDFESIDNADTGDEGGLFEVDPMYELKVGTDVKLMSMQKAVNSEAPIWYAQDAGGGIWKLDLSFTHTSHAPERMFLYHAGCITGLDTSPVAHFVATSGEDHTVRVYDYLTKKQICHSKFNSGSSTLLWVPKIVNAKGTCILAGFQDGVVRLLTLNKVDLSQVRSKKSKSDFELNLTQVFKPHTKPVTVMTIDDKGELLATGSSDCTVFFFIIDDTYKPIGFVETASPVVSIVWSNKGKKERSVLVSCKDGTVLEIEAPDPEEHDTSKTFHLPLKNLKITEFFFKRVKDKLRKAEADAIKAKEKEAKRKKKEAERARRRERGLEEEGEEEQEDEEEEQEEEQVEEVQDHGPSQIIKGFYHNKSDKFFLSMDGWDAGYLYECEFSDKPTAVEDKGEEPVRSIPVVDSNDAPIRSMYLTHSKKFLLFGMDNGMIRIHPLEDGTDLEHLSYYWSFSIHDNHHGAITKIITSFDDKYVFTSGGDGNFFVHKFMDKAVKGIKMKHSLPSPKKLIGEDGQEIKDKVDDIDDPNFYSIELEKQKAEHDRMVKLAEEKKQNVRSKITNLRKAFKQLMSRNHELPDQVQLKSEEFIIDPDMKNDLKAKTQEKIDLVHKELAWETEKHSIGLKKMQKRFKDEIECERIVLRAFNSEHLVSTFRASKPDYLETLQREELESNKVGEGPEGGPRKSIAGGRQVRRQSTKDKIEPTQQSQQQPQQQTQGQSQLGGKVAKALEKAEARRKKRLNRQAQWDELNRNKPDENYEDPKDKATIKEAKENMGDYKLKTAKDYVVPESQRVNADKKRLQLLKLLDQIHQYKFDFNQSFLSLRNKKIAIIEKAKDSTAKILEIQKKMDSYARRPIPKVPEMMPDEQPEKRLAYTRERLLEFKKQLKDTTKSSGGQDEGGGFGGFGGFGGGGGGAAAESSKPGKTGARDRSISSVSFHSTGRPKSSLSGATEKGTPEPSLEEVPEELSPLEQLMLQEERIKLQYEQDLLIDGIKAMMEKFDADLRTLRHDKAHLEIALKCADLRQVTLFEEFMLLKDFEKRENVYANKVNTKMNEKDEMQDKVEDCQMTLEAKKQEIDKLLEQEKTVYTTFSTALGENNKFENFLTRVFKKKIKRAKKKPQAEEGSDEDSDEEDSDDDLSSSDEEDSDAEELDDSVCPPGCDQALFDQICQLREKKLDLEELLADEKKTSETLKKEYDALVKKAKIIDSALNTAEADLEAFQREKQQKLNELDVVVILRLSQIQHMVNNAIPQDLSQSLIFNAPGLNHLQYRIKELEKEKHEQKRLYREHRQKHVELIRDKKVMESRIAELEEKVQNMMMLKFGRLVDLEKLEKVTVSRTVEELKEKLRQQEIKSARDIAKWDVKIDSYKGKTTQLTRENTQRLDTFTILLQEKKELEQMLDSRQKSLGTEFTGARKADLRERQRLIQLVQLQAQEIDALKDEITLLSRKGGHILPPAQPPLPPGQTPIPNT